ncbi:hypothetical protein [Sinorhizobium medicae]|uniref:hypothetical protein n=1 Tax=Sinorhizobium medicae TaxID=110321 RepID=UPI0012D83814|nr:hypothetical protein [Sinorhizobium medicae]
MPLWTSGVARRHTLKVERGEHLYHAAMMDPHTAAELDLDQVWSRSSSEDDFWSSFQHRDLVLPR